MAAQLRKMVLLRLLSVTGGISSAYLLSTGVVTGGRLATEELNPNSVGHVAALAFLAAGGTFLASRRLWWLACAAPGAALVVLSQSRGALLVVAVGALVPWVFRRFSAGRMVLAASTTVTAYAAWPLVTTALSRILSSRIHAESDARVEVLQLSGRAAFENPLTGLGWRNFPDFSARYLGVALNTHNEYARVAAEAGVLALIVLVTLAVMGLRRKAQDREDWALRSLLLGGLTALTFANSLSSLAICAPLWVALGAILADRAPVAQAPSREESVSGTKVRA
jgi:O-antigen ligase